MGYLLLEGGAEFSGSMSDPDLQAIQAAGGLGAPIAILPTAAAPDHNHQRAGRNGMRWFQSLGARQVDSLEVIDKASANDPGLAAQVRKARLVYLLGGFPRYLCETLRGSHVWQAALEAYQAGAVIGGSSAGAMILCEHYYDPESGQTLQGLDLVSKVCILPHHNQFGKHWASRLEVSLPQTTLIGLDEQTGILNAPIRGEWRIYGAAGVTLYHQGKKEIHSAGEVFRL